MLHLKLHLFFEIIFLLQFWLAFFILIEGAKYNEIRRLDEFQENLRESQSVNHLYFRDLIQYSGQSVSRNSSATNFNCI